MRRNIVISYSALDSALNLNTGIIIATLRRTDERKHSFLSFPAYFVGFSVYLTKRSNEPSTWTFKGVRACGNSSKIQIHLGKKRETERYKSEKLVLKVSCKFLQIYARRFTHSKKYLFILWRHYCHQQYRSIYKFVSKIRIIACDFLFESIRMAHKSIKFKPQDSYLVMDLVLKHLGQVQ